MRQCQSPDCAIYLPEDDEASAFCLKHAPQSPWEEVDQPTATERLPVPGGWIYRMDGAAVFVRDSLNDDVP